MLGSAFGAVGMRGPHRYAPERLTTASGDRHDKIARFERVFREVEPDVLAVRDNLLTPSDRTTGILRLAEEHDCGVLLNKPLGQGLLTGAVLEGRDRTFGAGDHRSRKRWFQPDAAPVLAAGLRELQRIGGGDEDSIIRLALWSCLVRSDRAAVLVGFTTEAQVEQNLRAVRQRPSNEQIVLTRAAMAQVQRRLDAAGEVFTDETATSQ
jgi:methylglyoxal reductase